MENKTFIVYDVKNRRVHQSLLLSFRAVWEHLYESTDLLEKRGYMFVNEIEHGGVVIREFASVEEGHAIDLIVCDDMASNVSVA